MEECAWEGNEIARCCLGVDPLLFVFVCYYCDRLILLLYNIAIKWRAYSAAVIASRRIRYCRHFFKSPLHFIRLHPARIRRHFIAANLITITDPFATFRWRAEAACMLADRPFQSTVARSSLLVIPTLNLACVVNLCCDGRETGRWGNTERGMEREREREREREGEREGGCSFHVYECIISLMCS